MKGTSCQIKETWNATSRGGGPRLYMYMQVVGKLGSSLDQPFGRLGISRRKTLSDEGKD